MFNQRMPRLVEADNESEVSSAATSSIGSRSSMLSGNKVVVPTNRPHKNQPLTGRITIEAIEDFLNPIANRPAMRDLSQLGLVSLPTATGGYGLMETNTTMRYDLEECLERKRMERERAEASYRSMRREFEEELMRNALTEMNLDENNVINNIS
jgi:hypothetical protein